jgi:hypothetical protein
MEITGVYVSGNIVILAFKYLGVMIMPRQNRKLLLLT